MLRRWSVREVYRRRRRARRHYLLKSDALIADGNPLGCFGAILGLGIVTLGGVYGINCLMTTGSLAKLVVAQFSNPLCLLGHTKAMRIFSVLTFATCYGIMVFILARFWGYGLAAHRRSEERRGVEIEHSIDALAGLHPVCVSKLVNATGLQDDIVVAVLHLAAIGALDISRPIDKGKGEEERPGDGGANALSTQSEEVRRGDKRGDAAAREYGEAAGREKEVRCRPRPGG